MKHIGIIGWRGMVGSILLERMQAEGDFDKWHTHFFSTSQAGQPGPEMNNDPLMDAYALDQLQSMDIIITCQGSDYTKKIHPTLRSQGWTGYWIDAASALRMNNESTIALDPVNGHIIEQAIHDGCKDFTGGNCTVSLMLMGLTGLFKHHAIEWLSTMTYQAASGAGAQALQELLTQYHQLGTSIHADITNTQLSALTLSQSFIQQLRQKSFPTQVFHAPLAGSLIPWIDSPMDNGQTREEWKGQAETNKILQTKQVIPVDGICVRIGTMRCHSQAITLQLNKDYSIKDINHMLMDSHDWFQLVPNTPQATQQKLTPVAIEGSLNVAVGRIKKTNLGKNIYTLFTVGDQLLWGAAEPLRRMLLTLL